VSVEEPVAAPPEPAYREVVARDPAAVPVTSAHWANSANLITLIRLLLVPVFGALLLHDGGDSTGWRIGAFVVFAVASLTDRVDGQLARSRNLVTAVGKIADPIADKALTGTALAALSVLGDLPWWVTALVLARELGITGLRFWVIRHGVIPASRGGKVKTGLQGLAIGCYVLPFTGAFGTARAWLLGVAVVVTVVTGLDYVARALRLRRTSERAAMKRARRAARLRGGQP
jgi:CDP-diacylglycerol--glycerol-3-phosphate 3-phosphatidyltransferase